MNTIVIDLEMCKVSKKKRDEYRHGQEIIQIGAVKLNDTYEEIDRFSTYVSPRFGALDPEIINLTGIKEHNLKGAPEIIEAMEMFYNWIGDEDVIMVSWSMTDKFQFVHEFEEKDINDPRIDRLYANWVDCQKAFSDAAKIVKSMSLSEALIASDIYQEGAEHDGLTDAYNTAVLYKKIKTEEEFRLNEDYYNAKFKEPEHLAVNLGNLFANIKL